MDNKESWDKFYREVPIEKIPWNKTPADFFDELLKAGKLGSGTALDLGCGVGRKSIALRRAGFEVTGVDISEKAIEYAKKNAEEAGARVEFIAADATDLSFLGEREFDLVLDWANLHGLPIDKVKQYAEGVARHTKKGGKFLLRVFSKRGISENEIGFLTPMGAIYYFGEEDVEELFGKDFRVLDTHKGKTRGRMLKAFDEYLMERV